MPAMDTVRRLADHDARISALVDQLPRVDSSQEARQIGGLLEEQLGDMAEALAFAADGKVKADIELQPLSAINTVFERLAKGEVDRDKYLAIGESDRMTLKFVKP